jgi:hypothetical protein
MTDKTNDCLRDERLKQVRKLFQEAEDFAFRAGGDYAHLCRIISYDASELRNLIRSKESAERICSELDYHTKSIRELYLRLKNVEKRYCRPDEGADSALKYFDLAHRDLCEHLVFDLGYTDNPDLRR